MNSIANSQSPFHTDWKTLIEYPTTGILSKVILKDNHVQYTLFCLAQGTSLDPHTSSRNALVNVIEGNGNLKLENETIELKPGVFVYFPAHALHSLQAESNLAFLLILSETINQTESEKNL